eukprot:jgi/Galph1/3974/GphlegSOOS_G2591.1
MSLSLVGFCVPSSLVSNPRRLLFARKGPFEKLLQNWIDRKQQSFGLRLGGLGQHLKKKEIQYRTNVFVASSNNVNESNQQVDILKPQQKTVVGGKRCPGCGWPLQTQEKEAFGYVPQLKSQTDNPLCQRCFQLVHYGKLHENLKLKALSLQKDNVDESVPVTTEILNRLRNTFASLAYTKYVVLFVVDVFDFMGGLSWRIHEYFGACRIILCVNKIDLLPDGVDCQQLIPWINRTLSRYQVTNIEKIHFVSAVTGKGIESLRKQLLQIPRGKRIFVVGSANVGKSSVLNKLRVSLLEESKYLQKKLYRKLRTLPKKITEAQVKELEKSKDEQLITTSVVPGTTLGIFPVKIDKGYKVYDTPGILLDNNMNTLLTMEELKATLPRKTIRPVSYRIQAGQCLFLGGLARIQLIQGKPFFVTIFLSSNITIHIGSSENTEEFVLQHAAALLKPPFCKEWIKQVAPWEEKRFVISGEGWKRSAQDIVIAGLGWVSFTGSGTIDVACVVPHGIGVELREAMLPYEIKKGIDKFVAPRVTKT